jgi:hypothetical protein
MVTVTDVPREHADLFFGVKVSSLYDGYGSPSKVKGNVKVMKGNVNTTQRTHVVSKEIKHHTVLNFASRYVQVAYAGVLCITK